MEILIPILVLLFIVGYFVLLGIVWWKIFGKAGFPSAMGLLMYIPVVNFVMLVFLAFAEWPVQPGAKPAGPEEKKKSNSELPVIIGVIAALAVLPMMGLMAAIAIPNLLRAKITANEAYAKAQIRTIAMASESYATANAGQYPASIGDLTAGPVPYLQHHACGSLIHDYSFQCQFSPAGYALSAEPLRAGTSGTQIFTMTTGGVLKSVPAVDDAEDVSRARL